MSKDESQQQVPPYEWRHFSGIGEIVEFANKNSATIISISNDDRNNWWVVYTKLPPPSQQDRSVSQPGKEEVMKLAIIMRDDYNRYISTLGEEMFVLRKFISKHKDLARDYMSDLHIYEEKQAAARGHLSDSLKHFIGNQRPQPSQPGKPTLEDNQLIADIIEENQRLRAESQAKDTRIKELEKEVKELNGIVLEECEWLYKNGKINAAHIIEARNQFKITK